MPIIEDFRNIVGVVREQNLTFMAAGIAHYVLASMIPLLLLALAVGSYAGKEDFVEAVLRSRLSTMLSDPGQQVVAEALTNLDGHLGAGLVGVVATVWSGSKAFRGLSIAFAELYEFHETPSLLEQLREAVVVMVFLVLAVVATAAMRFLVELIPMPVDAPILLSTAPLLVTLVVVLLPIYYFLSPVDVSVAEVLPGTVFTAFGFIVLQAGFFYYTQQADQYKALGAIGALLLFVMWLYFGSLILLLGGALNFFRQETR